MKELSLHILDIVQNSITAKATLIKIMIDENEKKNAMTIEIIDNGIGMSKELVQKVTNPFVTTRTTRKVGLGISLFKAAAERCNGKFYIDSALGKGTKIYASFEKNHIDRAPIGNMAETIISMIISNEKIDYLYVHWLNDHKFVVDTREVKKILGDVPLNNTEVIDWIKHYLIEGLMHLKKENK
ncbi:ATP-binding protein [Marinisporobacter balticus]|uniref:histidine kinase n=1 Tax=Marinisporobacter balticus TaxID=2018667 RepID=A0A4R2LB52_9FIRM|nr:ATP-binding protein [Marinisporobacter balticus]TCO79998.1 histidine kinase/DNA gyrase B/HSP90-like ATPase [Marinisporobacter balticus]